MEVQGAIEGVQLSFAQVDIHDPCVEAADVADCCKPGVLPSRASRARMSSMPGSFGSSSGVIASWRGFGPSAANIRRRSLDRGLRATPSLARMAWGSAERSGYRT